jgi:hypothetical protein
VGEISAGAEKRARGEARLTRATTIRRPSGWVSVFKPVYWGLP